MKIANQMSKESNKDKVIIENLMRQILLDRDIDDVYVIFSGPSIYKIYLSKLSWIELFSVSKEELRHNDEGYLKFVFRKRIISAIKDEKNRLNKIQKYLKDDVKFN